MDRDEDTLSFASMVNEDKPNMKPLHISPDVAKLPTDPTFEFRRAITSPSPSPADLLFSNGSILPQRPFPRDSAGIGCTRRCLRQAGETKSVDSVPKRVSFQDLGQTTGRPRMRSGVVAAAEECVVKRGAEKTQKRGGFFGSIVSACRECRALEPSKRVKNVAT